jgi:DNA-binding beta-propeller fold protein YncE
MQAKGTAVGGKRRGARKRKRKRGPDVDDRRFDGFTRRVGTWALPLVPRRGLLRLLGGGALAGAVALSVPGADVAKAQKCRKEGRKCDKKKCKQKDQKCCCRNLKCKNDRCRAPRPTCPTDLDLSGEQVWTTFTSPGPDSFNRPWGITTDPDRRVYVTDKDNERVLVFNRNGNLLAEFGEDGEGSNDFRDPRGVGFNTSSQGNARLFVADPVQDDNDDRIRRFEGDIDDVDFGDRLNSLGNETGDNAISPYGVAIDPDNRVWVVNRSTPGVVYRFDRNGQNLVRFEPAFTSPGEDALDAPQGIAVFEDRNGNDYVFVADTDNGRIVKFRYVSNDEATGLRYVSEVGSGGGALDQPAGLDVDACGNVWVADEDNNRIVLFDRNLDFIEEFDDGFDHPTGVAVDPNGDFLYVVDSFNNRVKRYDLV